MIAGIAAWWFLAGPGSPTTVPRVTGQPYAQAQSALQAAHLSPDRVDAFDETIPPGVVISTDPGAGSELRRSQDVTVTVSKGPERYAVPQVVGASANEATARIKAEKLTLGDTRRAFSETVADGLVISVSPKEGASLKRGAKVDLVVSKGREPLEVTDFTGKPADDAVKDLTGKGLEVDATRQENDDTVPKGSVISQSPSSGTLFKGDKVTLVVSKGPELVEVPDVQGKQEAQARRILEDAGFQVKVDRFMGGIFGTVRSQNPAAGSEQPKNTTVTLVVV